jgi:hypothetical protein
MSSEREHPELAAIEDALHSLAPAPSPLDRDRLMFLAGRVSVQRRRWLWCGSGAAVAAAIAAVVFIAGVRAKPEADVRIVYLPIPPAPGVSVQERVTAVSPKAAETSTADAASWDSGGAGYLRLQRQVLRVEFEALPTLPPTIATEAPLTQEYLHNSALSQPSRPGRSLWDAL